MAVGFDDLEHVVVETGGLGWREDVPDVVTGLDVVVVPRKVVLQRGGEAGGGMQWAG